MSRNAEGGPMASPSLLAATRVVLVHPFYPENLGAIARAMKNMGLAELVIAEPGPLPLDHPHALQLAVHAEDILARTRLVPTLEAALGGVTLAIGTSARPGAPTLDPRQAANLAAAHVAGGGQVALVFGNEKNGLAARELALCHQQVRIPAEDVQASLNLAQAVMVLAYEWHMTALPEPAGLPLTVLANEEAIAPVLADLDALLETMGFLKPHTRAARLAKLRRIASRALVDESEARQLRSLAQRLAAHLQRSRATGV